LSLPKNRVESNEVNLLTISWKSLRQRALASSLTGFSVALSVMLIVLVLVVTDLVTTTFSQQSINYDLIIGPKGASLQLVLNTVYHVSSPIASLPYRYYREVVSKDPRVLKAIPFAVSDSTEKGSFPIVGTLPEFFDIDYAPRKPFLVKNGGHAFQRPFDSYIGDRVARQNGWTVGTKFKLVHSGVEAHTHDEEFEVVGVLAPTGTPHDRTVYVHLEGFYQLAGHDKPLREAIIKERQFFNEPELTEEQLAAEIARLTKEFPPHDHGKNDHGHKGHIHRIPDVQKEVTAILVQCKSPIAAQMWGGEMRKNSTNAMGVNPVEEMKALLQILQGPVFTCFLVLTVIVIIVSGIGIFVSIYNSMSARSREIAIMRALGAQRGTVLSIIIIESILLCVGGGLFGLILGHGLILTFAPMAFWHFGIIVNPAEFSSFELLLLPVLLLMGAFVGFLPGLTAYRTDVAQSLN
jgi:putative ABC transport system permease protein